MKIFTLILALLLPLPALAADLQPPQPNYEIIDGKKFFMLKNARRQQNTSLSPAALAVINHPRTDFRVSPEERLAMQPVSRAPVAPAAPVAPGTLPAPDPSLSKSDSVKQELLSIFAPDEKPAR